MVFQEGADRRRIFARAAHPQFDGLETAQQHPGGMRIADGADGVAHHADRAKPMLRAEHAAGLDERGHPFDDEIHCVLTLAVRLVAGLADATGDANEVRLEEHKYELPSLMRLSY